MPMVNDPVDEVSLELPCTSLPKLTMLRLHHVDITLEGVTPSSSANPLPSLTSLKATDSPAINPDLHLLTDLRQLSLSDMDYPTGNLMMAATALTQLTRLRLEWTGLWGSHKEGMPGRACCVLHRASAVTGPGSHTYVYTLRSVSP